MNLSEIDWSVNKAEMWPAPVKAGVIALMCLSVVAIAYYFDTQEQYTRLDSEIEREAELKRTFEVKQKKAANLDVYRKQLEQIEQTFGDLLKQLPDRTQVPELLVDVSQTGLASGLEFELFKPGDEANKEFYAELPIQIRVIGDYLKFGTFVSGLASLPRIVTVHNVKIARRGDAKGKDPLVMDATVKTYRYLEETAAETVDKAKTNSPANK
ncbi:MAG: type 4a pilus biogenesis protein PilO [Methylotetracoccus sp.]|jgi:type IV pilus assembly protein PilO|nr:type 4a pilus biogenesis protein PilO [Methylotetracoccus sp.]